MHARTHTQTHARTHAHTQTHTHTDTRTHTHTDTRTHAQTHACTHTTAFKVQLSFKIAGYSESIQQCASGAMQTTPV